jgi:hypothetical protein
MERFTINYLKFFESAKSITPDLFEKTKPTLPEKDEDKVTFFVKNWYPNMKEVSNGNMEYFEKNGVNPCVFQNLKFLELTNNVNQQNKNIIWEYLHTLYALSVSSAVVKEQFANYGENENDEEDELMREIKEAIDSFPDIVSNMVTWRREKKDDNKSKEQKKPPLDEKFLENSKLAKLAKEISNEINPDDILNLEGDMKDMDNPMKLFQSLLSGDKDKGVGKLMTTVCDKLKNKMENGEVNQEDLLNEATSLLQNMGGLGAGENKDGPDLSGMMSMMQNLSTMGDLFNGPAGGGGSRQHRGRKVRRKMEKKLRKNRKKKSHSKNN